MGPIVVPAGRRPASRDTARRRWAAGGPAAHRYPAGPYRPPVLGAAAADCGCTQCQRCPSGPSVAAGKAVAHASSAFHPRASWLLFSNTATTGSRSNLTVRLSCDNGQDWPVRRTVEAGPAAYSTLTPLDDGTLADSRVGLLWERNDYADITYSSFGLKRLGGVCAPVTVTPPAALPAGKTTEVTVRVVSQNDVRLPAGTVSLKLPAGWSAPSVVVPALAPGQGADVRIPVAVPANAGAAELAEAVHAAGTLVMADVSTVGEGRAAAAQGADFIGTTLSGYVPGSPVQTAPDLTLVTDLAGALGTPVIAEAASRRRGRPRRRSRPARTASWSAPPSPRRPC